MIIGAHFELFLPKGEDYNFEIVRYNLQNNRRKLKE